MTSDTATHRAELAARLADTQATISELQQLEHHLKTQILETTNGPDTYDAGPLTIIVRVANRLDTAAIAAKYPADRCPELYTLTIDTRKVRTHLAPIDLEALSIPGAPSVTLK